MAFFVKITGSKSWVLSDVKVDNVVGVGSLHRNGEGISWVKGERDKSARRRVHEFDASGENLKFQKTRISPVKPDRVLAARFRSFHHRNPFVVVTEQRQI
jgi:hypothetical protein